MDPGRAVDDGLTGGRRSRDETAAPGDDAVALGRRERDWQRDRLPDGIRTLVLDDQRLRNDICWSVFT